MNAREARFFPFDRLGLRRNPFGSLTDEEWLAVTVIPPALHDLLRPDCRYVQFSADEGRGKTTLLLTLHQYFLQQGETIAFEKLVEGQRRFTTALDQVDGFALDEAQRLGWLERRRLFRHIGDKRLFITTHEDLTGLFRRYGKTVVKFSVEDALNRDHLAKVLERRLNYFAWGNEPGVAFTPEAIDWLWQRFGTDVRGCEHYLYEVFQGLGEPGSITAAVLKSAAK